ncbi:selenocysteine-specific translation elongation factor [Gammaproteobacteria bacterium]|nr:selenocysteine-specific translation elongation factor [Gammaproteobacteria bacterium]
MIIATSGHVDHGKTSLVNALTGIDTDRLKEEKKRGLTIDLGFAYSEAESGERLGFVDVPGHTKFISNMLAGVSAIDCALLVIAADDGVMPQTLEHLEILNLLGIEYGLIALTKIDRCDEEQINRTQEQITQVVSKTFFKDAEIYPVSSITNEGIETLQVALELAADDIKRRRGNGQFRLAIDRRFSIRGSGVVVTGSVFAGSLVVGDELFLMPQAIPVRIRGLHTQNKEAESATTGDRCAVNISGQGIELDIIHRGNWLTTNPAAATTRVDIELAISSSETRPFSHWTPVHVHSAANHVTGRVALLETADTVRIAPGQKSLAQLVFDSPINLCFGDRVIIRDQAATRTIGGGRVINTTSPKRGRAKPERIEQLRQMNPGSIKESLTALILDEKHGTELKAIREKFNLTGPELESYLNTSGFDIVSNQLVIPKDRLEAVTVGLIEKLEDWHKTNPGKSGLPRNKIRQMVKSWHQGLFDRIIDGLISSEELLQDGNLVQRPGYGVQLNKKEMSTWQAALPHLQQELLKPPVLHELASTMSVDPKQLEKILNQVVKTGLLVRPVKNRFFLPEAIPELIEAMSKAADDNQQFTVKQYRDQTGIGRNLSIEILEYFDRQGITRRIGDLRQIMRSENP